jgi:methylenetetrahydrofolate dehydrogenase (NADP+) / methenyltetrahydrofolate cyclohydrolase
MRKVRVAAAPSDGKANIALIKLIASVVGVAAARRCAGYGGDSPSQAPRHIGPRPNAGCGAGENRRTALRLWLRTVPGKLMTARIIDGKTFSANLRGKVADAVHRLRRDRGIVPGIAVVLIGDNPASQAYVRNKSKAVAEAGMQARDRKLPAETSEAVLLDLIAELNADETVSGILVQLPLPKQIDPQKVIAAIDPAKDVDGFHPLNAGRLASGLPALVPCTPLGCIFLAKTMHISLEGLEAVVIGRSNIVGKPVAQLLLAENATVTIAHSKTHDLAGVCRRADLLIAALGRPEMVRGDWIKPGATVIDVGINRVAGEGGKFRTVGDVAFAEATQTAGAITPVPGGVGPMTVACLLLNTLQAVCAQKGLPAPAI